MDILDIAIIVLLIMWLGGYSLHFAGNLIHILLVLAIISIIVRLIRRI